MDRRRIDMKPILAAIFAAMAFYGHSQQDTSVRIYIDPKIDSMVKARCNSIRTDWRVQLEFAYTKEGLAEKRKNFIKHHKKIETEIFYDPPYWMLRAGRFETEEEAQDFLETIRKWYPSAMTVKKSTK